MLCKWNVFIYIRKAGEMSNIQPSFVLLILLWLSLELCLETLLFSSELNFKLINPLEQLSCDILLLHKSFICWNGWHFAESGHLQVDTGHWNMMSYLYFSMLYDARPHLSWAAWHTPCPPRCLRQGSSWPSWWRGAGTGGSPGHADDIKCWYYYT